jgi:hypothetical protein
MINRDVARFGGAVCLCLSVAGNAATAADCGPKVEAAFQALQTSGRPYRSERLGALSNQESYLEIIEFVPPDRMRYQMRKIISSRQEDMFEFIRVGDRAWDPDKGEFPGLVGVFDDQIERLGRPFGAFECLGPVKFSDKTYTGYRTYQVQFLVSTFRPAEQRAFWRTVLVDRETGLLAYEIATPNKQLKNLKWRTHYTYPNNIVINPPVQ